MDSDSPAAIQAAKCLGLDVTVSTKFWCEHFGLPSHPTIVDTHYRDSRYSFGSTLARPRPCRVAYQLWTVGSQRVLLRGDPDHAARFARSCRLDAGEAFEVFAPLTNKGYGSAPGLWHIFADRSYVGGRWEYGTLRGETTPLDVSRRLRRFAETTNAALDRAVSKQNHLCVYLYAVTLLSERPHSWCERTGNSAYALAILVAPVYAGLYVSAKLADRVALSHVAWAAPAVAVGLGVGWLGLSQLFAWRIRRRLGERDRSARLAQLARQEVDSLNQARELFESEHYDLSVVEAWRALEARLRQVLLSRGLSVGTGDPQVVIHAATKRRVLTEPTLGLVIDLKRHWSVAVSTEPLTSAAANEALSVVRHVLAVTPVSAPDKVGTAWRSQVTERTLAPV